MSLKLIDGTSAESETPTPWAVHCIQGETRAESCNGGLPIYLTKACYSAQMGQPDYGGSCPRCGGSATWDDDIYEAAINSVEPDSGQEVA